jgi:hypothetical protein
MAGRGAQAHRGRQPHAGRRKELARLLGLSEPDRLAGLRVRSAQDIAGLELLVGWVKLLRLARVHKGQLVPVKQHRRLLDDPLELFYQAAAVLPQLDRYCR